MSAWLTTSQVAEIFAEEMAGANGDVREAFHDDSHLFVRGVLRPTIEVAPHDKLQGGVALCATDADIFVHPYVFRIVCTNGAIMATATQTVHISRDNWEDRSDYESELETTIRTAVRSCCMPEAFVVAADQMRSARHGTADMAIMIATFMGSHRVAQWAHMMGEILRRYDRGSDRSSYGLMNAITSVARDTRDPQTKWRLEELGGSVPAMLRQPAGKPRPGRSVVKSLVEVG